MSESSLFQMHLKHCTFDSETTITVTYKKSDSLLNRIFFLLSKYNLNPKYYRTKLTLFGFYLFPVRVSAVLGLILIPVFETGSFFGSVALFDFSFFDMLLWINLLNNQVKNEQT